MKLSIEKYPKLFLLNKRNSNDSNLDIDIDNFENISKTRKKGIISIIFNSII